MSVLLQKNLAIDNGSPPMTSNAMRATSIPSADDSSTIDAESILGANSARLGLPPLAPRRYRVDGEIPPCPLWMSRRVISERPVPRDERIIDARKGPSKRPPLPRKVLVGQDDIPSNDLLATIGSKP